MSTLYKVLYDDGRCCHGGRGKWFLPKQNPDGSWTPGEWMPRIEVLEPYESGYHLCRGGGLLDRLGPAIFEVESRGGVIELPDMVVASEARLLRRLAWDARTARLFACDCAEHVLPIYERRYPSDERPRRAIEVARRFADGEATVGEWLDGARAAWVAAHVRPNWPAAKAAEAAAAAARYPAGVVAAAARDAAWFAAEAARDAAWFAAEAVVEAGGYLTWQRTWAAEKQWQTERLLDYLYGRRG